MRKIVASLAAVLVVPALGAQVLKLGNKPGMYLISMDEANAWKKGDVVCIVKDGAQKGCGPIRVVKGNRAVFLANSPAEAEGAAPGDAVALADASYRAPASTSAASMPKDGESALSPAQISVEVLGAAIGYALSGSYRISPMFAANLGFSYLGVSASAGSGTNQAAASVSLLQVPVSASLMLGGAKHFFEVMAGADLLMISGNASSNSLSLANSGTFVVPELGFGYRLWPPQGGFHFRASAYLLFLPKADSAGKVATTILPWPGFSFGYAF